MEQRWDQYALPLASSFQGRASNHLPKNYSFSKQRKTTTHQNQRQYVKKEETFKIPKFCVQKKENMLLWAISPTTFFWCDHLWCEGCIFCVKMDNWLFFCKLMPFLGKIILFCFYTTNNNSRWFDPKWKVFIILLIRRKKCENDFYKRDCHLCEKFAA